MLQELNIDPKPPSVGLQFPGVDISMNGALNGIPLEPPNPAICVGNGFVMEVTNDVRIFAHPAPESSHVDVTKEDSH